MESIIFIGIQAAGKTTFYKNHFFDTHIRISLDQLNTKNKQNQFLQTCFDTQSKFVIDNTNPEVQTRKEFIEKAKQHKYKVIGYYFSSEIKKAIERNNRRVGKKRIPEIGIKGTFNKLVLPKFEEGFDELYFVKIVDDTFEITPWKDEI
ncbi:MAG: AAA family ATPase [Kordia sp.]|uniref:AAA family ATPase n=1 Tax=Kordia sp. TaxID=1965332 RepID=UPI00385B055D